MCRLTCVSPLTQVSVIQPTSIPSFTIKSRMREVLFLIDLLFNNASFRPERKSVWQLWVAQMEDWLGECPGQIRLSHPPTHPCWHYQPPPAYRHFCLPRTTWMKLPSLSHSPSWHIPRPLPHTKNPPLNFTINRILQQAKYEMQLHANYKVHYFSH